jgi:uncharacterized membrane protein
MTKKRILLIGLLLSISINLFFVGGIAYRVANFDDERFGRPLPPNVGWVVRDLEESRRSELEPQLRESFQEIFPIRREMMTAQRQVNDLMSTQPFDANALNVAFASLREANIRYRRCLTIRLPISSHYYPKKNGRQRWNLFSVAGHAMAAMVLEVETADLDSEGPADQMVDGPLTHHNLQMQINE